MGDTASTYTEEYYWAAFTEHLPSGQKIAKVMTGDFRGDGGVQAFIITTDENPDPDKYWDMDYGFMASGLYYMDGNKLTIVEERNQEGSVNVEVGRVDSYDADILIVQCLMGAYAADRNCDGLVYVIKDDQPILAGRVDGYPSFTDGHITGSHLRIRSAGGVEFTDTTYDIADYELVEISQEIWSELETG